MPLDLLGDLPIREYAELIGAMIGTAVAAYVIHRGRQSGKSVGNGDDANTGRHGDRLVHIETAVERIELKLNRVLDQVTDDGR